jgi:hypothetical protein
MRVRGHAVLSDPPEARDRMNRITLQEKGHSAYVSDGALIVEWYDFGENAPYESPT